MRMGTFMLIVAAAFVAGCGTTHQFFPAAPLEKKHWQLTVNWHFDVGRNPATAILPDVSVFYGIDQHTNFGFNPQFPFFVGQASIAHYEPLSNANTWMTYFTANQLLGFASNPYLEAGVSYNIVNRGYWQMHRLGIAYGHGLPVLCGLFNLAEASNEIGTLSRKRFMPVVGYSIGGTEFAVSYVHYHGATKSASLNLRDILATQNDTILFITRAEVDSAFVRSEIPNCPWSSAPSLLLYAHNGDTIGISASPQMFRCGTGLIFSNCNPNFEYDRRLRRPEYSNQKIAIYQSHKLSRYEFNGDMYTVMNQWFHSDTLIFTKYDAAWLTEIDRISDWTSDHSFALGQINYIRPKANH
jgi:hypothetical protein